MSTIGLDVGNETSVIASQQLFRQTSSSTRTPSSRGCRLPFPISEGSNGGILIRIEHKQCSPCLPVALVVTKSYSCEGLCGGLIIVGDGINDAPALAAATVGIVLAQRASATAIAVADVLLLQENISSIPFCIAKARQTTVLVKQSVLLALSCILLAALPSVLGFLPLWLTVLLHEGGTLLVCLNSFRALNNPTWSWKQDFHEMLQLVRESFSVLYKKLNPAGCANHRATV